MNLHLRRMSGGVQSISPCQKQSGKSIGNELSTTSTPVPESTSLTAMLAGMLVTESKSVSSVQGHTTVSSCETC